MNKLWKIKDQMLKNYYLLKLKRDQWKSLKYLKDEQLRRLRAIVKYAYDYVPYYHRLFASAKIKPEDIRTFDDLLKIPLTDKQMIQKNYDDMFPLGVDVSKFASSFTSGSTGIPLKIVFDNSARSYMAALTQYIFSECGVRPHDKFVTIWGRAQSIVWSRPYVRFLRGINEILVPAFFEETKLVNVLRCINPDVLCTFPSILSLLANSDVSEIRPRLIFTQGETVTQDYRDTVKKAFNRELLDTYGSVEFEFLAFECNTHRGLHMITDGAYIEFIDENGECVAPREEGEIIVTGLYNRVMPLIRYRIGDAGIPTNEKCPCGRSWPLIKSILGRMNDYLILPSGRKISFWNLYYPHLYNELKKNEFFLTQYQIIQDRKDRIIFKLIKGREFDLKIAENIKTNLEAYFAAHQEDMKVIMQFVDEIPQERTGKRRWLICMLQ